MRQHNGVAPLAAEKFGDVKCDAPSLLFYQPGNITAQSGMRLRTSDHIPKDTANTNNRRFHRILSFGYSKSDRCPEAFPMGEGPVGGIGFWHS